VFLRRDTGYCSANCQPKETFAKVAIWLLGLCILFGDIITKKDQKVAVLQVAQALQGLKVLRVVQVIRVQVLHSIRVQVLLQVQKIV